MKKIKVGVFGAFRGDDMIRYCCSQPNVSVVAVCDKVPERLEEIKRRHSLENISYETDFDEFLKVDMDAVVLANYADEHAPFAISALKRGFHVFSEVLPTANMSEAVALVEAVESSGKIYAYGENYCYMPAVREMKRLYKKGIIGEFEYGEGEYIHNCEPIWPLLTGGDPMHWRNRMFANYYCTHSIGPLIHMTGLRPIKVTGFEGTKTERKLRCGAKGGSFGIEMIELENGGIIKSIHGDLYRDSIWFCAYGSKGRMESRRLGENQNGVMVLHVDADKFSGEYDNNTSKTYSLYDDYGESIAESGHFGSDDYLMQQFIDKICGKPGADIINVYEAMDMFLPGIFAYRSVLAGGIPMQIPDLRNKAERDRWRNDTACTNPKIAGDMLIPSFSTGAPDVPEIVYANMKQISVMQEEQRNLFEKDISFQGGKNK